MPNENSQSSANFPVLCYSSKFSTLNTPTLPRYYVTIVYLRCTWNHVVFWFEAFAISAATGTKLCTIISCNQLTHLDNCDRQRYRLTFTNCGDKYHAQPTSPAFPPAHTMPELPLSTSRTTCLAYFLAVIPPVLRCPSRTL